MVQRSKSSQRVRFIVRVEYGAIREISVYDDVEDLVAANEYVIYKLNVHDGYGDE